MSKQTAILRLKTLKQLIAEGFVKDFRGQPLAPQAEEIRNELKKGEYL